MTENRQNLAGTIADSTESPRKRRPFFLRWPTICCVVLMIGAGALFIRLLGGPLYTDIGTFELTERIKAKLGPAAAADISYVGLSIDPSFFPVLHLQDVAVSTTELGRVSSDTVRITTRWSSFLGFSPVVSDLVADHVVVEPVATERPIPAIPAILAGIDDVVRRTGIEALEVNAFTLFRRGSEPSPGAIVNQIAVTASAQAGDKLSVTLAGEGVNGPWSVAATVAPGSGATERAVALKTRGLDVADLSAMAGDDSPSFTGPVSITGRVGFSRDGLISEGDGEFVIGPLRSVADTERPVSAARSRFKIAWRPSDQTIEVEPSQVALPDGYGLVIGSIRPPRPGDPAWRFQLAARAEDTAGSKNRLAVGSMTGSYDPTQQLFIVDQLKATGEGAVFNAAMRVSHADGQITGALSGLFPKLPIDILRVIWPPMMGGQIQRWVNANVQSGLITDAQLDLTFAGANPDVKADPKSSVGLAFRFQGLVFRPYPKAPLIRGAAGTATLSNNRFEVVAERGEMDLGDGRTLNVAGSRYVVPDISLLPARSEIEVLLAGDAASAVALWRQLPVSRNAADTPEPSSVSGAAQIALNLKVPLIKQIRPSDVEYSGTVKLSDFSLNQPERRLSLKRGELNIAVARDTATINGTGLVDGVEAEIDFTRSLKGGASDESTVRLVLNNDDRKKLGVDLGGAVDGSLAITLTSAKDAAGEMRQFATVDLASAAISIPAVGFVKPKGKSGTATFEMRNDGSRTVIENISVKTGSATIEGGLVLGDDKKIQSGSFPLVRFSEKDNLSVKLARTASGVLKATVTGTRFDGRDVVRGLLRRSTGKAVATETIEIDVTIGSVLGFGDEALQGVNLAARMKNGSINALSVTAQTAGGGSASATLAPTGSERRLQMEAGEIGRLLRFAGLYSKVLSGRATVAGVVDDAGGLRAEVDGSRWRIVDEPALARLSSAAKDGPTAGYSTADIERLVFDLALADGRLTILDGVIRTASAGLSIQGDVDFRRDVVSLSGSYMPVGGIDSLIGQIPILGQTVFAGGRAGLLGVTYRLTGTLDAPNLTVNPLSLMAPGIFRKLFEAR